MQEKLPAIDAASPTLEGDYKPILQFVSTLFDSFEHHSIKVQPESLFLVQKLEGFAKIKFGDIGDRVMSSFFFLRNICAHLVSFRSTGILKATQLIQIIANGSPLPERLAFAADFVAEQQSKLTQSYEQIRSLNPFVSDAQLNGSTLVALRERLDAALQDQPGIAEKCSTIVKSHISRRALNIRNWTPSEVAVWMNALELPCIHVFKENEISGQDLLELTHAEMDEMGILQAHQKRIIEGLKRLREFQRSFRTMSKHNSLDEVGFTAFLKRSISSH